MSIKKGLENVTLYSAKALATTQTGVDRVLWGKKAMVYKVQSGPSGSYTTQAEESTRQANDKPNSANPLDYGVFPILDLIVSVDLCNLINYILAKSGGNKPAKREEEPNKFQKGLYYVQDKAALVQQYIDSFTSAPNILIGKYTGFGPEAASQQQIRQERETQLPPEQRTGVVGENSTVAQAAQDSLSGSQTQKFNLANLVLYIKQALADGTLNEDGKSIFTPEDQELLTIVPGLSNGLNTFNDYINKLDSYTDYRNISNADFQKALALIEKIRSICVLIQGLDIKDPLAIANTLASFLLPPGAIQEQVARLQKFINPAQAIPTIKKIDSAIQSFIQLVRKAQQTLTRGQFIIKIALLLIKIFQFILKFLKKLPVPNIYTTLGISNTLSSICTKFEKFLEDLKECVEQINSLLLVFLAFTRYVLLNTEQLSTKLGSLVANLSNCETQKDSPVVKQIEATLAQVKQVEEELKAFVTNYENRANTKVVTAGKYTIKILEEEITDEAVRFKRRRGVALDLNGILVAQSDLTFATENNIIIEEVRRKLRSMGLIPPGASNIDIDVSFLDEDILLDDLNVAATEAEDPDNEDEEDGLGLQAFVNKLKGGKRLRRRTRRSMAREKRQVASQIAKEDPSRFKTVQKINKSAAQDEIAALELTIRIKRDEIIALKAIAPVPNPGTTILIAAKLKDIREARRQIAELRKRYGI